MMKSFQLCFVILLLIRGAYSQQLDLLFTRIYITTLGFNIKKTELSSFVINGHSKFFSKTSKGLDIQMAQVGSLILWTQKMNFQGVPTLTINNQRYFSIAIHSLLSFPSFINLLRQIYRNNIMLGQNPSIKVRPSLPTQFPLYFTNPAVDAIAKTLTAFGNTQPERIIYMGPRHTSNLRLLRAYSKERRSDNEADARIYNEQSIERYQFDSNEKEKYYPTRSTEYRLFTGLNPTAHRQELRFDSNFQCGNLDLVVSLGANEYDLFLRVDSNTKGHTCWFFFKVTNFQDKQRVKFNLCNFSRGELSYESGMGVYTYRSSCKQWTQEREKMEFYASKKCNYTDKSLQEDNPIFTLSFQVQFKREDEFVYLAYCVPYSYSLLQHRLKEMEKKCGEIMSVDRSNLSVGGLPIPVVTVAEGKEVCLVIGRLHPGETQGSWLLQGFLDFLCSPKGKQLREKMTFKIVPMINIDGVIAGNFRTNLLGRDINRCFNQPQLLPQVALIRSLAAKYKPLMFLDFHGHSSKKNVFTYGPDYAIDNRYFLPCRLFSKIISKCTRSFRYYACNFRVEPDKKSTGRAVMLKTHRVIYCFTVEASAHAYGIKKEETLFNRREFLDSGAMICHGLDKFLKIVSCLPKKNELTIEYDDKSKQAGKKVKSSKILSASFQGSEIQITQEGKRLLQEILSEQRDVFSSNGSHPDSDFQQGNDYSQKQLSKLLEDSFDPFLHRRRNKKDSKHLFNDKPATKHERLISEGNFKVQSPVKSTVAQVAISQASKRQRYKTQIQQLSPDSVRNHSQSMNLNFQFNWKSKMPHKHNNNKDILSQDNGNDTMGMRRISNLNHLSLDYTLGKVSSGYEPLSEFKKMKEKTSILLRKRNKLKDKEEFRLPLANKKQGMAEIKLSLLPYLNRNGNQVKEEGTSTISEIFQTRQKTRNKRPSRNIKILFT